jgi:hypothetical protein
MNKKKSCIIENIIEPEIKEEKKIKFIDLFCGIGSFHYSFKKLNWKCVMSCDIDKAVKETYKENYGLLPLSDITEIEPKDVPVYDILCAGFPCFVSGTQTLTNNGYKNIEDVEITDRLLTHAGKFKKIINLQRKIYTGDLFDIKISEGTIFNFQNQIAQSLADNFIKALKNAISHEGVENSCIKAGPG